MRKPLLTGLPGLGYGPSSREAGFRAELLALVPVMRAFAYTQGRAVCLPLARQAPHQIKLFTINRLGVAALSHGPPK